MHSANSVGGAIGTTAYVRDYLGVIAKRGQIDLRELLEVARQQGLPLLSSVDMFDDTVFNRMQVSRLLLELADIAGSGNLEPAMVELRALAAEAEQPHRYLVFNGD